MGSKPEQLFETSHEIPRLSLRSTETVHDGSPFAERSKRDGNGPGDGPFFGSNVNVRLRNASCHILYIRIWISDARPDGIVNCESQIRTWITTYSPRPTINTESGHAQLDAPCLSECSNLFQNFCHMSFVTVISSALPISLSSLSVQDFGEILLVDITIINSAQPRMNRSVFGWI
jgi:hypothetical protein